MTAKPQDIIRDLAAEFGELRTDYSGRGMYGSKFMGIVTDRPNALQLRAASIGLRGAQHDSMGQAEIVYWPKVAEGTDEK